MMLILFLTVNFVCAILYVVGKGIGLDRHSDRNRSDRKVSETIGFALFFIFLPGLGFVIYFLPEFLLNFLEVVGVDREAVLTHVFDIERVPEHPDLDEALNVVPIEDELAIGDNSEKRALLLRQLKRDLKDNYKILLSAQQDEDSECAHYVASAKMEIYRLVQMHWLECRKAYELSPGDPKTYHNACAALIDLLESEVLSAQEMNTYRKRLCSIVQKQIDLRPDVVSLPEYEKYLGCLVDLKQYRQAEMLWKLHADQMRSEEVYHQLLKMYFNQKELQKFENTLDDLCRNKEVHLSAFGLDHLRYWKKRLIDVAENNSSQMKSLLDHPS